jgi:hypothetical protein
MLIPWWRVGNTMINPHQVVAVQFLGVTGGDLLARVYVNGRRATAVGEEAHQIRRLWEALTGARRTQLGYYFREDDSDNGGSEGLRDAA